jgi:acyl carrier protein
MTLAVSDRLGRIKEIVCEHLELETDDVTDTSNFHEDQIDQEQFARIVDVSSAYDVVAESAGW